jgi:hypothetical protein
MSAFVHHARRTSDSDWYRRPVPSRGMSSISVRPSRFEAVTVAVRESLVRRSSRENRIRA